MGGLLNQAGEKHVCVCVRMHACLCVWVYVCARVSFLKERPLGG